MWWIYPILSCCFSSLMLYCYHFAIVWYVTQPDDRYMNYKMNHLHLLKKMMVDFSLSAVIFATPRFHQRNFFLRHPVLKLKVSKLKKNPKCGVLEETRFFWKKRDPWAGVNKDPNMIMSEWGFNIILKFIFQY